MGQYLSDWLISWPMQEVLKREKSMVDTKEIESGIKGGRVFMRVTDGKGSVVTTTFTPSFAREFAGHLIGQANLLEPQPEVLGPPLPDKQEPKKPPRNTRRRG